MKAKKPPFRLDSSGINSRNSSFSQILDASGNLIFAGKAILHSQGMSLENGQSKQISMHDLQLQEPLGQGQYGTVFKALYKGETWMAVKEIKLQFDPLSLNQILTELEVLNQAQSNYIVGFYGAFFYETSVYYCMELMEWGSIDKLYQSGFPELVVAYIAKCMIQGLKYLKDALNIIHRDVKPSNVLVNSMGHVKLCDFGVSGNLVKSTAKTNVGCQAYMAPERILSPGVAYTIQSDVYSLGLSLIEMALGFYPFPQGQYESIFATLQAIVNGPPPCLPLDYSKESQTVLYPCLDKDPKNRPSYEQLLISPWVTQEGLEATIFTSFLQK